MRKLFLEHPLADTRVMGIEIPELTEKMYSFIANNFFQPLHIDRIDETNLHHIFDAIIAFRACYWGFGFYELVDEMNILLDTLAPYLGDISDEARYRYRLQYYRELGANDFIENTSKRVLDSKENEFLPKSSTHLTAKENNVTVASNLQSCQNHAKMSSQLQDNTTQNLDKPQTKFRGQQNANLQDKNVNKTFKNADFIPPELLDMIRK